ncbi:MAG: iron hydrogenase small subunit, partial [Clostridia bacterium]|nr:iron hydrogenase small subunit [Clostridia bacterium]
KFEVTREELGNYTDSAITTRELAKMIKEACVDFANLSDTPYDDPFGLASGAGAIFGATGGVMEAALRTAAKALGDPDEPIVFNEVRGTQGLKEATFTLGGVTVNVAIASGLANARKIIESIKSGEKNYTFVEVMACPGGCINGGGQPYVHDEVRNAIDLKTLRAQALYDYDSDSKVRCSHENATVTKLYKEFFGEPNSHKAHELLHTSYVERPKY